MPSLQNDIRQFYSYTVLKRFDRLEEAAVRFTFDEADIFISAFDEAMTHIENSGFSEQDQALSGYAKVFENYVVNPVKSVSTTTAGIVAASLYWLSGYSANSYLVANAILTKSDEHSQVSSLLLLFLARRLFKENQVALHGPLAEALFNYVETGEQEQLEIAKNQSDELERNAFKRNFAEGYLAAKLLKKVLDRLQMVSIWESIKGNATAPNEAWKSYMRAQMKLETPVIDLWPSQRKAIEKGLLDGKSSVVLKMPTSAGKTKMTELAFVNDLMTQVGSRCLYLAPFRALVSEVEKDLGKTFSMLDIPIASLYGGSDANAMETELAESARVVVATPEKIKAVLSLSEGKLSDYGTVVLDEGHLLDSISRGAAYELQLANFRQDLGENARTIFLSAVLPNSDEIASWLGGSSEFLAEEQWQPTSMRIGIVTWPKNKNATLTYVLQTGQQFVDKFFVPRVLEEEEWKEVYTPTKRERTYRFPQRGNNATIAAALGFKYAKNGPVIIYSARPDWAEGIAQRIIDRLSLEREIETNLIDNKNEQELRVISAYLSQILGDYSTLPQAVANGFAFHHGQVPQGIRLILEEEFRKQTIRMLIATNTLAQGVNLPAKSVILHSLPRSDAPIRDFWNLAGRAGRALKESDGEVIILQTGTLTTYRLRQFLDKNQIEPVYSQLLSLVFQLLQSYPQLDQESLNAFLDTEEAQEEFSNTLDSLDIHIAELLAEDLDLDAETEIINELITNLFATYQAENIDLQSGTSLKEAVTEFVGLRANHVRATIPDWNQRKRFTKAGISLQSCLALEDTLDSIFDAVQGTEEFSADVFETIINSVGQLKELQNINVPLVSRLGCQWIEMATYSDLFESNQESFRNYGALIRFVEDSLCYRIPWVLNGVVRLLESKIEIDKNEKERQLPIPDWLKLLPQMIRFGVPSKELVWIMSMGLQDRNVAGWLLDKFRQQKNRKPRSLKDFVNWAVSNKDELLEMMEGLWPAYFLRLYADIIDRYKQLRKVLAD